MPAQVRSRMTRLVQRDPPGGPGLPRAGATAATPATSHLTFTASPLPSRATSMWSSSFEADPAATLPPLSVRYAHRLTVAVHKGTRADRERRVQGTVAFLTPRDVSNTRTVCQSERTCIVPSSSMCTGRMRGLPAFQHGGPSGSTDQRGRHMSTLLIVLLVLFVLGGGGYGYSRWRV
jgi:hypothetical protein